VAKLDPCRCMIARVSLSPNPRVDVRIHEALRGWLAQQQVTDAQPGITRPVIAEVVTARSRCARPDGAHESRPPSPVTEAVLVGGHDIEAPHSTTTSSMHTGPARAQ